MGRSVLREVGVCVAFLVDLAAIVYSSRSQLDDVSLILLFGRILGLILVSVLAVKLAVGRRAASAAPRRLETSLSGSLLPSEGEGASGTGLQQPPPATPDGDERARRIDATVASQREQVAKLKRGAVYRDLLMWLCYFYVACCSMYTAISTVQGGSTLTIEAGLKILSIVMINVEFILLKGSVLARTTGEPIELPMLHEHPLYWTDVEGGGYVQCSVCNEKIGEKTSGYLVVQCRVCEPSKWGFGGYQVCTQCFRKNAIKKSAESNSASGMGILRTDLGPQAPNKLSVGAYVGRLAGMIRTDLLVVVLCSVGFAQAINAYIPKAQGDCISSLVRGSNDEFDQRIFEFAMLVIFSAILGFAKSTAIQVLSSMLYTDLAVKLFKSLVSQDIAFYDNAMTGQLTSRLQGDLRQAVSPVQIIINSFVANLVMLVVGFGICMQASWRLTILAFTFLAPMVHISAEFSKWSMKIMATQFTYAADAQGAATQSLTNIRTVRSFGAQSMEIDKYSGLMKKVLMAGLKNSWGQGFAGLLTGIVSQGASFIILYYGGHLALRHSGGSDVGDIITFTYLWNRLSSAFAGINDDLNQPVKAMSAGQRVFEVLDLKPSIVEGEDIGQVLPSSSAEVQLHNVEFAYQSRSDKPVLGGVNFTIQAGKITAVVGKSGCGKSTVSKLLMRFYDPQGGSLSVNGLNLKDINLQKFRQSVGVVSQDTQLFRVTVAENIAYGLPPGSYTVQDVEHAAKLANAHEFIRTLPEGYKTLCGEGGHDFSGGQKQRMSIARALVRKPALLLLDEATSALDAENEAVVQEALDSLIKEVAGRHTIMVIAHRLSTIKDADHIVVLHEGKVVEQGTHESLLKISEGRYATMVGRQLNTGSAGGGDEEDADATPTDDSKKKEAQSKIEGLLDGLPEEQQGLLLMGLMPKYRKAMMAGKGAKGAGR